jgi:hypothetical protein
MVYIVKIEPNGNKSQINLEEYYNKTRVYNGIGLLAPERLFPDDIKNKYKLSMYYPDIFNDTDEYNHIATLLFNYGHKITICDADIFGTVYVMNEDDNKQIDFTIKKFEFVFNKLKKIRTNELLSNLH